MRVINLSHVSSADEAQSRELARRANVNLHDCYQCGKCTAGCPMGEEMDLGPRQVIHALQLGLVDRALDARGPWICAQCEVCSTRCPQNIDITGLMYAVRMHSYEQGRRRVPESEIFEHEFIAGVRSDGRSNEQYLAGFYNLKSGHLFQDMTNVPQMLSHGLIGLGKHKVKNKQAVKDIVDACLAQKERGE